MASLQKQLHEMDSEELLVLWRERRGVASEKELAEIQHHMEDAETEMGGMAVDGMPFPGELTGGGGNKQLHQLSSRICYEAQCLASGGTMLKSAQKRELTSAEKDTGRTQNGISQPSSGEASRKLTKAEMTQGKLLVNTAYTADEFATHEMLLEELKAQRDLLKQEIYECLEGFSLLMFLYHPPAPLIYDFFPNPGGPD